jgi:hypothetical protein
MMRVYYLPATVCFLGALFRSFFGRTFFLQGLVSRTSCTVHTIFARHFRLGQVRHTVSFHLHKGKCRIGRDDTSDTTVATIFAKGALQLGTSHIDFSFGVNTRETTDKEFSLEKENGEMGLDKARGYVCCVVGEEVNAPDASN